MTVYEKASAEIVMFEVNDVISTSGGKEIAVYECDTGGNGSFTGTTDKDGVYGYSSIV